MGRSDLPLGQQKEASRKSRERSTRDERDEKEGDRKQESAEARRHQTAQPGEAVARSAPRSPLSDQQEKSEHRRREREMNQPPKREWRSSEDEDDDRDQHDHGKGLKEPESEVPARAIPLPRGGHRLFPIREKEEQCGEAVEADDLHENGESGENTRQEQPDATSALQISNHRQSADRRQEEVVPGGKAREVVRNAPDSPEKSEKRRARRRYQSPRDPVERRHENEEADEEQIAQREETNAEQLERERVSPRQEARVRLVVVPVRQLSLEHALRGLRDRSFVVRDPAAVQERDRVEGDDEDRRAQEDALPGRASRGTTDGEEEFAETRGNARRRRTRREAQRIQDTRARSDVRDRVVKYRIESSAVSLPISIVVPVYNSEGSLPDLAGGLLGAFGPSPLEILFVNDGSEDRSWSVIQRLAASDPRVRGMNLMRNYGQHNALLAGIRAARGEIVVTMDDDLQHPPEEIPKLLAELARGYDVVYGTPARLPHSPLRNLSSWLTKLVLQRAMGAGTARRISAFRAFRTRLRRAFEDYSSPFVSIDVILTWGTRSFSSVIVEHRPRPIGRSQYTLRGLIIHALTVATGFSTLPLRLASVLGFCFTILGLVVLLFVVGTYVLRGGGVPGFPFLASIIAIFSGAQFFALGIIGEYLARIHGRMMERPTYVIEEWTSGSPSK